MKKRITFLFALICATSVFAAKYDCKIDGIYYNLNETNKTATVTNQVGNTKYVKRSTYSGVVSVPSSITYNGNTYSVTTIGRSAFYNCSHLTSVTIPNSVTSIESYAFYGCEGLTSIEIPNSVISIGMCAFIFCSGLTSVTIGNSVTMIGDEAFSYCRGLTSITLPNSVTWIGEKAFYNCSLTSPLYNANCFAYMPETYKGEYTIPNGIKQIAGYAFCCCKGLTSVTIPYSVKTIGDCAFTSCSQLKSVTILNPNVKIVKDAFNYCTIADLYCGKSVDLSQAKGAKGTINNIHYLSNEELAFILPFEEYARRYVESRINRWQKKGDYEKTADWQKRVNETTRKQKVNEYVKDAEKQYLAGYAKRQSFKFTLGNYDPDNEVFLVKENQRGDLLVSVPIADAQYVGKNWSSCSIIPHYVLAGTDVVLQSIDFTFPNRKTYTYKPTQDLTYAQADIQYNFDPIELNLGSNTSVSQSKGQQTIQQKQLTIGKSEVDTKIPQTGKSCPNTFAVIISNENYTQLKEVPCAVNDGKVFAQYCEKTIGLPKDNIKLYTNATYGMMIKAVHDMQNIANAYNGDINIIFYYSGHGAPTDDTKEAYLLPVDAFGVAPEVCYSLNKLYKEFADMKAKSVTMFLDACFSGATKDGDMLASVRGVAIKAKANAPTGNMVVFSAASDEQTALPYLDMGHGMFTYYLLKKLQETKGDVTYQELGDYVKQEVYRRSSVVGKVQTPTITAGTTAAGWQNWKLK